MLNPLKDASLRLAGLSGDTTLYELSAPQFKSRFFIVSHAGTQRLMAYPEVVGFDAYLAMLPATTTAMGHLFPQGGDLDILTILRGGLNYPVEEACHRCGIRVRDIHFLSCERVIVDQAITGLDIRYEKMRATHDRMLVIGDIIATGDTLRRCLSEVISHFREKDGSIRRIIFFTIGGTQAISLMEEMTPRIREVFPGFEGFDCFFYEGIFTVYRDKGASGINTPDIDFGWKDGLVSPEFRGYVLDRPETLLEKCIIYDGGARRYEIPIHFHEVLDYWNGIVRRADRIDPVLLVREKLGYDAPLPFDEWLEINHFQNLPDTARLKAVWEKECALASRAATLPLRQIAEKRVRAIQSILKQYE